MDLTKPETLQSESIIFLKEETDCVKPKRYFYSRDTVHSSILFDLAAICLWPALTSNTAEQFSWEDSLHKFENTEVVV